MGYMDNIDNSIIPVHYRDHMPVQYRDQDTYIDPLSSISVYNRQYEQADYTPVHFRQ